MLCVHIVPRLLCVPEPLAVTRSGRSDGLVMDNGAPYTSDTPSHLLIDIACGQTNGALEGWGGVNSVTVINETATLRIVSVYFILEGTSVVTCAARPHWRRQITSRRNCSPTSSLVDY